jgi:WD40 repeat protein
MLRLPAIAALLYLGCEPAAAPSAATVGAPAATPVASDPGDGQAPQGAGAACSAAPRVTLQQPLHILYDLALAPDGARYAVRIDDERVALVDVASGLQVAHVQGSAARFAPDGLGLYVRRGDQIVRLTLPDLRQVASFTASGPIGAHAVDRDGTTLATSAGGRLEVWDAASGRRRCEGVDPGVGAELELTAVGHRAYTCAGDQLAAWDTSDCRKLGGVRFGGDCQALAVGADGQRLVASVRTAAKTRPGENPFVGYLDDDPPDELVVLDATDLQHVGVLTQFTAATDIEFMPDGRTLLLPDDTRRAELVLWPVDGDEVTPLAVGLEVEVKALALAGDGAHVAMISANYEEKPFLRSVSRVHVWSQRTRALVGRQPPERPLWRVIRPLLHGATVMTQEGDGMNNGLLRVDTGALVWSMRLGFEFTEWSPDDGVLALPTRGALKLFDTRTGASLPEIAIDEQLIGLGLSRDGARVLLLGADGRHRVHDARTGAALQSFAAAEIPREGGPMRANAALSPDGSRVLLPGPDAAEIWDVASGERTTRIATAGLPPALPWSADGRRVVLREGEVAAVFDATSGARLAALPGLGEELALSADGTRLVGVDRDGALRTHDVATGAVAQTLAPRGVLHLRLDAGGALLAIGAGEVSAWDLTTGARLGQVAASRHAGVARLADGRWLVRVGAALDLHAGDGTPIASFVRTADGTWASWTPHGLWDAGPGGAGLLVTADWLSPCSGPGVRHPDLWAQALAGAALPTPAPALAPAWPPVVLPAPGAVPAADPL